MIKAIIFDLDGTLLNTLIDLRNSVNYGLSCVNLPGITLEETRLFIGNGTLKLTERSLKDKYTEDLHKKVYKLFKQDYDIHYMDNTVPYEGIKELLLKLKNDGYLLGVVSNKNDDKVQPLINKVFPNMFDAIQGTYIGKPVKPDSYISNLVLDKLQISGKEAIMIGDTEVDKETAENANMDYILVDYGYRSYEEIIKKCPEATIVHNPNEVYKEIKNRAI